MISHSLATIIPLFKRDLLGFVLSFSCQYGIGSFSCLLLKIVHVDKVYQVWVFRYQHTLLTYWLTQKSLICLPAFHEYREMRCYWHWLYKINTNNNQCGCEITYTVFIFNMPLIAATLFEPTCISDAYIYNAIYVQYMTPLRGWLEKL